MLTKVNNEKEVASFQTIAFCVSNTNVTFAPHHFPDLELPVLLALVILGGVS